MGSLPAVTFVRSSGVSGDTQDLLSESRPIIQFQCLDFMWWGRGRWFLTVFLCSSANTLPGPPKSITVSFTVTTFKKKNSEKDGSLAPQVTCGTLRRCWLAEHTLQSAGVVASPVKMLGHCAHKGCWVPLASVQGILQHTLCYIGPGPCGLSATESHPRDP
jgi:hypothetical protein